MSISKVNIIGGGITGPAAALLLAKQGLSCAIYELRPSPSNIGGAINLAPNALRLLDYLGVYPKLAKQGCAVPTLEMFSVSRGSSIGTLPLGNVERHGYNSLRVLRSVMQDALLEASTKANIPIHYGKKLVAIEETPKEAAAIFADGTTATADILLGCDGVHSSVRRKFVDPDRKLVYTGVCAAYGLLSASQLDSPLHFSRSSFNNSRCGSFLASFYDMELTKLYWAMVMEVQTELSHDGWKVLGKEKEAARAEILRRLRVACNINCLPEMVEKTDAIYLYPVWKLDSGGKWFRERTLLLGDAAHAIPPHGGGQGVPLALEDTVLFSRLLTHFSSIAAPNISEIFRRFEEIRRKRVDEIYTHASKNWENTKDIGWLKNQVKEAFLRRYLKWFAKDVEKQWAYDALKQEL